MITSITYVIIGNCICWPTWGPLFLGGRGPGCNRTPAPWASPPLDPNNSIPVYIISHLNICDPVFCWKLCCLRFTCSEKIPSSGSSSRTHEIKWRRSVVSSWSPFPARPVTSLTSMRCTITRRANRITCSEWQQIFVTSSFRIPSIMLGILCPFGGNQLSGLNLIRYLVSVDNVLG